MVVTGLKQARTLTSATTGLVEFSAMKTMVIFVPFVPDGNTTGPSLGSNFLEEK